MQVQEQNAKVETTEVFKGFSLFNDIEDLELRKRNRAVIMVNLLADNFSQGKIEARGSLLIIGYMSKVPTEDRKELVDEFVRQANERGFKIQ